VKKVTFVQVILVSVLVVRNIKQETEEKTKNRHSNQDFDLQKQYISKLN
jgi:hypothetical protein